jgi:amino acid permease
MKWGILLRIGSTACVFLSLLAPAVAFLFCLLSPLSLDKLLGLRSVDVHYFSIYYRRRRYSFALSAFVHL